jgi:serine/threonine protein kinase
MPADPRRVKELFAAALDLADDAERQTFLDRQCAGDAELRRRLEELLHAHERPQPALDEPLAAIPPPLREQTGSYAASEHEEQAGTILAGKYKLLERIGEGGMGSVWMAQQTEPVKRTVAVKLIKSGGDSRAVLARFEQERQALALMDHPHIAKVLDGGSTETGQPFFVMELVKGVPITTFCDARNLTPRQRLELFVPVCQAIQHAHHKGVIHRDVKPSNVLVALYDDRPVPKVIDFGLAKATGAQLTEATLHTGFGALVGTPQYMSPEQATLNNLDIDTRSDVYSLGVLLYELLTGSPPFRRKDLEKAGMLEILRVIREEEPAKPSTKLSTAEGLPSLAANRSTEPAKLKKLLRGDIDWIVMKALEKERGRRYETANGFALDVQRYLADEPVLAGPTSTAYRLKKFVKRHKGQVVAAGLVLLALLAGVTGTTIGLVRSEAARQDAVTAQQAEAQRAEGERLAKLDAQKAAEAEKKAKEKAQKAAEAERWAKLDVLKAERETKDQAAITEAVNEFLQTNLLGQADIGNQPQMIGGFRVERNPQVTVRELLDRASQEIEGKFAQQELTEAAIRLTIGDAYRALGEYAEAQKHLLRSLQLRTAKQGADHADTLTTKNNLAALYRAQGKYAPAETLFKEVLKVHTATLGADHPHTLASKNNLALLYKDQGKYTQVETLYKEVLAVRTATLGADHPGILTTKNNLALLYRAQGKYAPTETLVKEVLAAQITTLGADHPNTLTSKSNLASLYGIQGKYVLADTLFKEVLKVRTAKSGAVHPDTLASKNDLAVLYEEQGKYAQAETRYKEVLVGFTTKLGADHPSTLTSKSNLAALYRAQGKYAPAETLFKEVLKVHTATLGADHPHTLTSKNNLAALYHAQGKYAPAETLYKEVLAAQITTLGADHPNTLTTKSNLAVLYWQMKKLDHSIPLFEELVQQGKKKLGPEHPDTLLALANLGVNYRDAARLDDGIRCLEQALAAIRKIPGPIPANLAFVPGALAQTYDGAKQYAKSEPLYREFLQQGRKQFGAAAPRTAGMMALLGQNLLAQKKHAKAESMLRDCLTIRAKKQPDDWATFNTKSMLGAALVAQKKYAEAEPLLKDGYQGIKKHQGKIPEVVRKVRLTEALQRLVQLYEATDNKKEAAQWRKELETVKPTARQP